MRKIKDSGVAWLGEIPENWQVVPSKALFRLRKEKAAPGDRQLTASQQHGIIYQDDYMALTGNRVVTVEKDFSILKRVEKGDFVISMRSFQGGLEYSENAGSISSAYVMLIPDLEYVVPEFYKWLFKSPTYITALQCTSNLIRDGQALRYNNFVQVPLCIIPKDDQKKIAGTLGEKCQQIDTLIINVQAQIEKLKAYKQSLITEVVTKGLDPDAPMKDSGVEWIGTIPASWKTIRVKQLLRERKERSVNGKEEPLSMSQKVGLVPTKMLDMIPNMASSFVGAKLAYVDDLVFNKLKAHLGVFSVSKYDGLVSPDYAVYYSTGIIDLKYLEYLFKTPQCISEFRKRSTGIAAGLTRLYTDGLFAIECPMPSKDEQAEIVLFLNEKCAQIDELMSLKQTKIEKLEQYKRSLIYEYVTGKKEVS